MRSILACALGLLLGCADKNTAPPPLTPAHRDAIQQNLNSLGAKITADVPEGLYLSLRNTHIQVRELGGVVEGTLGTQRDAQDFGEVNEAVAKGFLEAGEFEQFKTWLHKALAPQAARTTMRSEYKEFKVTLSRQPLRTLFTRKEASQED